MTRIEVATSPDLVDPGISWTGLVPSHWTRSRHSAVLYEVKRIVAGEGEGETLLSLTKQGVIRRDLTEGKGKFPASFDTYQLIEVDQLVFCLFDVDETPRTVGLAHERGMVTGAYDVFKVNTAIADPRYLEYYFIGIDDEKRFRPLYTGLRKVIQKPRFKSAPIMLPPLDEQQAIADYLDRETQRIDELIAEQRGLIETLRERRVSVVDQAVVGAMTAQRPLVQDTGFKWLGEIPRNWSVRPLWSMFERIKDVGHPEETMLSVFRDYGVIKKDSRDNLNLTAENRNIYQMVDDGWFVVNRMKAWQGSVGVSSLRGILSGHYICFRPRHAESSAYLNWLFRSSRYKAGYQTISRGVRPGQAEIDNGDLRVLPVLVPPIEEQLEISAYLEDQTSRIDALIAESEDLIALSQERRAALITAAVTGQIDVRTAA